MTPTPNDPSEPTMSSHTPHLNLIKDDNHGTMDGGRQAFFSKLAKLEFPKYSGDDPTEWFTKVDQFFEYQSTLEHPRKCR